MTQEYINSLAVEMMTGEAEMPEPKEEPLDFSSSDVDEN